MFNFDEFLYNLSTAEDYLDAYDYIADIDDVDLYNTIYDIISSCEDNNEPINNIYLIVENRLFEDNAIEDNIKDVNETKSIDDYIKDIKDAGNDKDLENIINEMDKLDVSNKLIDDVRQIFKNNRYNNLEDKKSRILQVIQNLNEYNFKLTEGVNGESIKSDIEPDKEKMEVGDGDMKTTLDYLEDRIGQKMTIGEFNTILQSLFGRYNEVFILFNDIYNMDKDEPQELMISDDEDLYTITYNIIDIMSGVIEITDVVLE